MWRFKKKEQVTLTGPFSRADIKKKKRFEFIDRAENWSELLKERTTAFTHSSSFVGQVIYDSESQDMSIILNNESYVFCSVPDRVYDAFEGSDSKGSFFNRRIKGQFDC